MEDISSDEIIMGVKGLQSVLPTIDKFIAPIIRVTHDLQEDIGEINLKQIKTSEYGLWQTSICNTCQTANLHTEKDCTYTLISVPEQNTSTTTVPKMVFSYRIEKGTNGRYTNGSRINLHVQWSIFDALSVNER